MKFIWRRFHFPLLFFFHLNMLTHPHEFPMFFFPISVAVLSLWFKYQMRDVESMLIVNKYRPHGEISMHGILCSWPYNEKRINVKLPILEIIFWFPYCYANIALFLAYLTPLYKHIWLTVTVILSLYKLTLSKLNILTVCALELMQIRGWSLQILIPHVASSPLSNKIYINNF